MATAIDIYYDYCSGAGYPIANTVARPVASTVDLHTVSIYSRNDFKVLRPCVTICLWGNGDVAPGAGCVSPFYNQCWCSSNIAPSATSHISSCITNLCTDNFDISTAVDIYYSYCSEAGHPVAVVAVASPAAPLSTAVQTTSDALTQTQTPTIASSIGGVTLHASSTSSDTAPFSPSSTGPSATNSTSTGNSSNNKLTNGEIVGIVIGTITLIVGVAALWYQRKALLAQLYHRRHHRGARGPDENTVEGTAGARRGIYQM